MRHIVSLSGGKDSVALWLWARRTGLDPIAIYCDTLWEWSGHSTYLDLLEARIGPIRRVVTPRSFADTTRARKSFPSRVRKWCTEELKLFPFAEELDRVRDEVCDEVTVLLGIRREESAARADTELTKEREFSDLYDCEIWRPILDWTLADVAAEHHRAAIPLHPLYHHGAERVGCWPCVNASKAELALMARLSPERVAEVRSLEAETGATMFTFDRRTEKKKLIASGVAIEDAGPSVVPASIDAVIEWANTDRGGTQFTLFQPRTGCARWGVCEAPPRSEVAQ